MRFAVLAACLWGATNLCAAAPLAISDAQALAAGKRLWQNECAGAVEGLTSWNAGEDFASLGIGHYIWYPVGKRGPFEESFPELVSFLAASGQELPEWLRGVRACPWDSRAGFQADARGAWMTGLRRLLAQTVALQARFSANRLQAALPKMIEGIAAADRARVRGQFERVAAAPGGVYALVDYVNFKGEGILPGETYRGQGWGLAQVLAGMGDEKSATRAFAASAARVLSRRVANSPPERREARWLPGWKSRVATYAAD